MAKKAPQKPKRMITRDLVLLAVRNLKTKEGSNFADIQKYLIKNFNVDHHFINVQIRHFISELLREKQIVEMQSSRRFRPGIRAQTDNPGVEVPEAKKKLKLLDRLKQSSKQKKEAVKVKTAKAEKKKV